MLNAAGLVSIKLERRLGMASPQFDISMQQATEATAAFCGVDLMQSNSDSATSLLSNGVHLMYYDHVVHIVWNQAICRCLFFFQLKRDAYGRHPTQNATKNEGPLALRC